MLASEQLLPPQRTGTTDAQKAAALDEDCGFLAYRRS